MGLTVIQNDAFASSAGSAQGSERVEALTAAGATNGAQIRKAFYDEQGFLGAFGRSQDGIQTFLALKNEAGTTVYIEVNGTTISAGTALP